MRENKIVPEKVTRPIQLLAAWLTGLVIIDGSFLTVATQIANPIWASGALVIAAIVNVPLFLISIFLLQTKSEQNHGVKPTHLTKWQDGITRWGHTLNCEFVDVKRVEGGPVSDLKY